jgi:formamidopyrimidine-DNA glycosylase
VACDLDDVCGGSVVWPRPGRRTGWGTCSNIYADEALWRARLHPLRAADTLTGPEIARLHRAVRAVLRQGIDNRGTSFGDYVDAAGEPGDNAERLSVYQRTGEPCLRCGTTIQRLVIGQRSSHFCPRCQRAPEPDA